MHVPVYLHRSSIPASLVMLLWWLAFAVSATAQVPTPPHIGYVYPAGGKQGSTFLVHVGGQYLSRTDSVLVSGQGFEARIVDYHRPLTQKEFNDLREKQRVLLEKRRTKKADWTPAQEKELEEIRKKLMNPPNRQGNPAIAEVVTLEVILSPNAQTGERELRLHTPTGLSNPMVFCVGQLKEFGDAPAKTEPSRQGAREGRSTRPPANMIVELPATINGQIMPGEVDRYRFKAKQGQRLVIAVNARSLIPYIADAVPGWFQATLALFDEKGREVAYDDDYRHNPDPVLYYEIPKDGEYSIQIKDSIFRGREDFVYRISIGEIPFITSIYPLGCQLGSKSIVEVKGWNLPVSKATIDTKDRRPGSFLLALPKNGISSNQVAFVMETLPETNDAETNDSLDKSQKIDLPRIVNGRIDRSGDVDIFSFIGKEGETIVVEVFARRLNSPLDSLVKVTDMSGKIIGTNDDHEDKGSGLTTHHADSRILFKVPSSGAYFVHILDAQHQGGTEYAYRIRISHPQPDFELRVTPASINLPPGVNVPITVFALRKDGFDGDIHLSLRESNRGIYLSGARIPAGQDKVRLTLTTLPNARGETMNLTLEGRAQIGGQQIGKVAVPADDQMQAFFYRHLVVCKELKAEIIDRSGQRFIPRVTTKLPVKIATGSTTKIDVDLVMPSRTTRFRTDNRPAEKLEFELSDPPEGIAISKSGEGRNAWQISITADPGKIKPGTQGNLIVQVFAARSGTKDKKAKNTARNSIGYLPAIPFEIVSSKIASTSK